MPVGRGLAKGIVRAVACCVAGGGLEKAAAGISEGAGGGRETGSGLATSLSSWKTKFIGFDFLARFLATCMRGRKLSRGEAGGACDCDEDGCTRASKATV